MLQLIKLSLIFTKYYIYTLTQVRSFKIYNLLTSVDDGPNHNGLNHSAYKLFAKRRYFYLFLVYIKIQCKVELNLVGK